MREIQLTRGKVAIVDDEDFERLSGIRWLFSNKGYAYARRGKGIKDTGMMMQRFILNPTQGMDVDHIDGNKLDNRKSNLRIATRSQNNWNQKLRKDSTTGLKGVTMCKDRRMWKASIRKNGRAIHIGYYPSPEEAHNAYCEKAKELFGVFAHDGMKALDAIGKEGEA